MSGVGAGAFEKAVADAVGGGPEGQGLGPVEEDGGDELAGFVLLGGVDADAGVLGGEECGEAFGVGQGIGHGMLPGE